MHDLWLGYMAERIDGDKILETLYAVSPEGDEVFSSGEHNHGADFDRPGRVWSLVDPALVDWDSLTFIGQYAAPATLKR